MAELPVAILIGAELDDDSGEPKLIPSRAIRDEFGDVLGTAASIAEKRVQDRLKRLGVDLILCWREGSEEGLIGKEPFIKHLSDYTKNVEATVRDFDQRCRATLALVDQLILGDNVAVESADEAATLAVDIAATSFLADFPPLNQEWTVESLRSLADEYGDKFLRTVRIDAKRLGEFAQTELAKFALTREAGNA